MSQEDPNLQQDIENARDTLAPSVLQLRGLFQLWTIFTTAEQMAKGYVRDKANLQWEARTAFTKAIVIEYSKPWSGRNGKALKSLLDTSKEIPFLDPEISANSTNAALRELRNRMVAHIDEYFESVGITFRGISVENAPQNRPKDEGTLDNVFLPVAPKMESVRGMWWIEDDAKWLEIRDHIVRCKELTQAELASRSRDLRDECFHHMHVLKDLSDLVSLEQMTQSLGADGNPTFDVQSNRNYAPTINISTPQNTTIGDQTIQGLVTIFEPTPSLPNDVEIKGKGYRLTLPEPDSAGQAQWNVQFPKYPFPAEPIGTSN